MGSYVADMPFCVKIMLYMKKVSIGIRRYKVGSGSSRGTAEVGDLHALNSLAQLTFGPVNTFLSSNTKHEMVMPSS